MQSPAIDASPPWKMAMHGQYHAHHPCVAYAVLLQKGAAKATQNIKYQR